MFEQFWLSRAFFQYFVIAALFAVSLVRGALPEQILSGSILAMPLLDLVYHELIASGVSYGKVDLGHLTLDLLLFAVTWTVAIKANRFYPLWLGGAQLIAVLSHLYRTAFGEIHPTAYAVMMRMPSYVEILAMAIGLACHMARTKRIGSYPSWRSSFARSVPKRRSTTLAG